MQSRWRKPVVAAALILGLASCAPGDQSASGGDDHAADGAAAPMTAVAHLASASGSSVTGTVTFTEEAGGVRIIANIIGLTPGDHGFHIHEHGDCSAPDASSAGGHFNPAGMPHAGPEAEQRHIGDLGNLIADADGNAGYERLDTKLTLGDGVNSIVGRAVIVHENVDDLTTQPTGNAGGRVACGVIEMES